MQIRNENDLLLLLRSTFQMRDQIRSDQNQCADLMREFESERVSDRNEHPILDRENCEKERSIEEILPKDPSG
ncbi:hypothetical protein AAC387_Pa12g2032 [Persea americana]